MSAWDGQECERNACVVVSARYFQWVKNMNYDGISFSSLFLRIIYCCANLEKCNVNSLFYQNTLTHSYINGHQRMMLLFFVVVVVKLAGDIVVVSPIVFAFKPPHTIAVYIHMAKGILTIKCIPLNALCCREPKRTEENKNNKETRWERHL